MKIKRLLNIGISAALVLSVHMGVAASNFINLEQMIQTHSEDELIRNEDGQVIGVDITNDEEEDSTEIVDFQTLGLTAKATVKPFSFLKHINLFSSKRVPVEDFVRPIVHLLNYII